MFERQVELLSRLVETVRQSSFPNACFKATANKTISPRRPEMLLHPSHDSRTFRIVDAAVVVEEQRGRRAVRV